MTFKDKQKQKEHARKHYEANKEKIKARAKEFTRLNIEKLKAFIFEYLLTHPCVDCGESDPVVLEFDHVRGEKRNSISEMVARSCGLSTIKQEIEKCEVRCANCHRRKTFAERNITHKDARVA